MNVKGGYELLSNLPKDRSMLSEHELESITTKDGKFGFREVHLSSDKDMNENTVGVNGYYYTSTTIDDFNKLTDEQFGELNKSEGHWSRDHTFNIYKLTDEQFTELDNYQNTMLEYEFRNDHRPEKKDYKPLHTPDEWFKLNPQLKWLQHDYTAIKASNFLGEF